ncbi:ATP-binding protein [Desulfobacterales bacterium HSG16]|nr:ATP-binding protein [Desulfobacterales bacterium HSG16]
MKYKMLLSVFILFTLIFSSSLKAGNINDLHFISYGKNEGLTAKDITDIYQDNKGYLWVATNNGIWKYNGSRFYQTISKKDGLSSNTVLSLFVDSSGVFWAGTPNGLNKIINGKVEKVLGKGKYVEVSGIEDENKNLWYVFDKYLVKIKNDRIVKEYGKKDGIKSDAFKIAKDRFDNIWLGTISSGIYKLINGKIEKRYTTKDGLTSNSINEIAVDGKTLWITDENGSLNQMRIADGKIIHKEPSITGYLHSSFTDKAGNIWLGSSVGLLCYKKGKKKTIYTTKSNLQSNYVNVTFEDSQGNIWVGTSGGVSKWIKNKIIESFPTSKVYAQAIDRKGRIWLGHPDGLRIFDGQKMLKRYSIADGLPVENIKALVSSGPDEIWAGSTNGLTLIKNDTIIKTYTVDDGLPHNKIWSLSSDNAGKIWVGTENSLAVIWNNAVIKTFDNELLQTRIEALATDDRGNIAAGTKTSGLIVIDSNNMKILKHLTKTDGLAGNRVRSIVKDGSNLWTACPDGGVNRISDYKVVKTFIADKDIPPLPRCITRDKKGSIRVGHDGMGLTHIENEKVIKTYTYDDGLLNMIVYSLSVDKKGNVLIGTGGGLTVLNPVHFDLDIRIDTVSNPEITKEGKVYERIAAPARDGLYIFSYNQNTIRFRYSSLDFRIEQKKILTFMEGFDKNWRDMEGQTTRTYMNMGAGKYTFKMKIQNFDGSWSPVMARVKIKVLPPFWKTWWAYCIYAFFIGSVIAFYMRIQAKKLERERVINERLVRVDKLKDDFLANTSHELKTPLNGIIGIAESLLDGIAGPLTVTGRKNLSLIESSGRRLANLVNDILDFSKMKSHDLMIRKKPVSIRIITDVVLSLSSTLLAGKPIVLKNEIGQDIPFVTGDEDRLQQIFHNLVGNAIKFTESGEVTVSAEKQDKMIAVSVKDTGIGIPKDKLKKVFKSFEQVDASTAREYGGTGLGLAVTRQFVELHGGTIRVESEIEKGSNFIFTLPVSKEIPGHEIKQQPEIAGQKPPDQEITRVKDAEELMDAENIISMTEDMTTPGKKFKILVVDDEQINQQVLANHLTLDNYNVTQALNGACALKEIAAMEAGEKFDLVLLDIMMPKMSGYEVAQKIREKFLPSELPILMLTAKNQVSDLVEGFTCGANDYLAKPLSKHELLARIKTHLNLLKINSSYSRFVPYEYLRFLKKESILDVNLGDHISKEMAIMFSDIRSFTSISEGMTPQENFDFVNAYLKHVGPPIRNHNGFIVKYLGDGMMAVFPNSADDAVMSAIDKLEQVTTYNIKRQKDGYQPIRIGIGVHIGHMMVGMIGESARMQGDALSDNVNLTSRIEGLTKFYGVNLLISGETLEHLEDKDKYSIRFIDSVIVKGRKNAISVFEVCDGDSAQIIELKMKTKPDFEKGQKYYFAKEFPEALLCFAKVLAVHPDDKTADLYLKRSEKCMSQGVSDNWDGVVTMTSK